MDDKPTDGRPAGGLVPFSDDCRELFHRALDRVGYPSESVAALRHYGDPRPRRKLPDGTEVVVQFVPPVPPRDRLYAVYARIVAEQVGCPISWRHRAAFMRELEALGGDLVGAVMTCDYGDEKAAAKIHETASRLLEIRFGDETWEERAARVWRAFRSALGGALMRYVLGDADGKGHRKGEGHVQEVQRDPEKGVAGDVATRGQCFQPGALHGLDVGLWEEQVHALAGLTEAEDEVWRLHLEGYDGPEIADMTDRAPGTVRALLHKARKKLKEAAA